MIFPTRKSSLIHAATSILHELSMAAPEGAFREHLQAAQRSAHDAWKIAVADEDAAKAAVREAA